MKHLKLEKTTNTDILKNIYNDLNEQFPPEELKGYEEIKKLIKNNRYELYLAKENDEIIGYTIIARLESIIWLDYIAVLKKFQGLGYGSKILKQLKEINDKNNGCLLEVEKPNHTEQNTIRRINFYKKLGAKKLEINYLYPTKTGGLPMDLYYIPYKVNSTPTITEIKIIIKNLFALLHSNIPELDKIYNTICGK